MRTMVRLTENLAFGVESCRVIQPERSKSDKRSQTCQEFSHTGIRSVPTLWRSLGGAVSLSSNGENPGIYSRQVPHPPAKNVGLGLECLTPNYIMQPPRNIDSFRTSLSVSLGKE